MNWSNYWRNLFFDTYGSVFEGQMKTSDSFEALYGQAIMALDMEYWRSYAC